MFNYININSDIHKIGPTYKILSLFIFFILFLVVQNISFSLIMLLFSIIISILSKVNYKYYIYRLIPAYIITCILLLLGLIFNISVYNSIIKVVSFSLYYSTYIFTTKFVETNKGLFDILNLFEIKNYKASLYITILVHLISIIYQEYFLIKKVNVLYRLYYSIDRVIIRIKQIINLNKVKKYNFKYKYKRKNIVGILSLASHTLLFILYFLGKM